VGSGFYARFIGYTSGGITITYYRLNLTALILHRLTSHVLLPLLFTLNFIRLDRTALADFSVVTTVL
jgi:hypothetical protein